MLQRRLNIRPFLPALPAVGMLMLLCALLATPAHAIPVMVFQSLTQSDGLSQNTVNDIYQDSFGFIWLATESGLNRYDGTAFVRYQRDHRDARSLPADFIWDIAEDRAGDIWLATRGSGLVRFKRNTQTFTSALDIGDPRFADSRNGRSLLIDTRGDIWLGTRDSGILQFSPEGTLKHWYRGNDNKPGGVYDLLEHPDGRLLMATDQGLWQLDPGSGGMRPLGGQTQPASSLILDAAGRIWIGYFEHGLENISSDGAQRQSFRHDPQRSHSLSDDRVRDIVQDSRGQLWVATQNGLNLKTAAGPEFLRFQHEPADPFSLTDDRLMSLAEDRNGLLWIGTRVGGVNRWNPRSWLLGGHEPAALGGAVILAFADGAEQQTWIGSFGAPLLRVNTDGEVTATFTPADGYPERGQSPVTALLRDRQNQLWIGTFDNGLQRYRAQDGSLTSWRHDAAKRDSLGADGIMSLYQDRRGHIWIGTFGAGISRIKANSDRVERLPGDPSSPLHKTRPTAIVEDGFGHIWVGTDGDGLFRLTADGRIEQNFRHRPGEAGNLGADTIYGLHLDGQGRLWIGTADAGLAHLEADQLRSDRPLFDHLTAAQGLPSNVINGLRSDDAGRLWISTNRGLVRYDPARDQLREFHQAQGLQSEELNFGAVHRSADGRLLFGGHGGYNSFDPNTITPPHQPPTLVITALESVNRPIPTEQAYAAVSAITLSHRDPVLSIEYAALDYTAPELNRYSVMLEGFDSDWSPPRSRTRSTYTNLDPGHYVFRIKAANSDGVWTPQARELAITVKPAPWATMGAKLAYLGLSGVLLWLFMRWRLRSLQRDAQINQLAYYDRTTGLPNRDLAELRGANMIANDQGLHRSAAFIVVRLGPFKHLQDSLGFRSTDDIMRTISRRLSQVLFGEADGSSSRELARLGEESFIAIMQMEAADMQAMRWARALSQAATIPVEFGAHKVSVPVRVGIACYPKHASDVFTLIKFADTAAHDAARDGQSGIAFYDHGMTQRALDRLTLESDLREAIRTDALELHVQGKFDGQQRIVGTEALARWNHPQRGAISPSMFVPLAEESDLILDLDQWVVGQACATLARWKQHGYNITIAVNVSAETFISGRIFTALKRNRQRYDFDPAKLEIEITESVLASDMKLITESLNRIKALGHLLSLDDFGTGYSSLTYLQRFPIDKLKIDQAFVRDLEDRSDQQALCTAIVALARSLNMTTVAEGVENPFQLDFLLSLGCDQMQGFMLHKPQAVDAFEQAWLARAQVPRNSS